MRHGFPKPQRKVKDYLLDVQPALVNVIASTTGSNTERYIHSLRGIHALEDSSGAWTWAIQDGLESVRMECDDLLAIQARRQYTPYLTPFAEQGTFALPFAATGEWVDDNDLLYLRARYYNPETGTFTALDPFEGLIDEPLSLNGYSYAHGNPINYADPSGEFLIAVGIPLLWIMQTPIVRGAFFGAAVGGGLAAAYLAVCAAGLCGCEREKWARDQGLLGSARYIFRNALHGAALGAAADAFVLSLLQPAWAPLAPKAQTLTRLVFGFQGLVNLFMGLYGTFSKHQGVCGLLQAGSGLLSMWGSLAFLGTQGRSLLGSLLPGASRRPGLPSGGQALATSQSAGLPVVAPSASLTPLSVYNAMTTFGFPTAFGDGSVYPPDGGPVWGEIVETGRDRFGELRFRGLVQNRPLRNLTHAEIWNAFKDTSLIPSNHAIMRLKDIRTYNVGMRTLNDYARHFNNGIVSDAGRGLLSIVSERFETILNPASGIIVTLKPG